MSTQELQEKIIANMRRWQHVEDATVAQMDEIIEKTENPLIRLVMEIIRADSENHYRVQELIASTLESETISFSPDEFVAVWDLIENHIKTEKEAERIAAESIEMLEGKKMMVQEYLLHYLLEDEAKHDRLLENMEMMKKGMYPYG
jgi:bacterioferritin (cytochrome b1)